jgi:hypothetical protein
MKNINFFSQKTQNAQEPRARTRQKVEFPSLHAPLFANPMSQLIKPFAVLRSRKENCHVCSPHRPTAQCIHCVQRRETSVTEHDHGLQSTKLQLEKKKTRKERTRVSRSKQASAKHQSRKSEKHKRKNAQFRTPAQTV